MKIQLANNVKDFYYCKYVETLFYYFVKFLDVKEFKKINSISSIDVDKVVNILDALLPEINWNEYVKVFDDDYMINYEITKAERLFFVTLTELPWKLREKIVNKPLTKELISNEMYNFKPKPLRYSTKNHYKDLCLGLIYLKDLFNFPFDFFERVYEELFSQ